MRRKRRFGSLDPLFLFLLVLLPRGKGYEISFYYLVNSVPVNEATPGPLVHTTIRLLEYVYIILLPTQTGRMRGDLRVWGRGSEGRVFPNNSLRCRRQVRPERGSDRGVVVGVEKDTQEGMVLNF